MAIIEAQALTKDFRQHRRFPGFFGAFRTLLTRDYVVRHAVREVSFAMNQGEAVGYVGPNGAGKSTTIKMLTGILVPSSGEVRVMGNVPHKSRRENAQRIGVVFGQRSQLWWDLPVIDSFDLHRYVYKIPAERYRKNLADCEELLHMREFIEFPVRQLSLGQRMRAEMALALLHDPEILFLDEPTIGLDVTAKDRIREFLRTINRERRVTIILASHDLKDIEEICSRLLVINRGVIVYDGELVQLKKELGTVSTIVVDFAHDPGPVALVGADLVLDEGVRKHFKFDRSAVTALDLLASLAERYPVRDVSFLEATIEDVIRKIYESTGQELAEMEELDTWTRGRVVTR
jgi:ABC-2 type transport system ATP-binding protein